MTEDSIEGLLDRVPGWAGRSRVIAPLEGGITNRNYAVTIDDARYVVRAPGEKTELLGIDRSCEREAAERAAALGIGPEVIAFVEPEGSLVTAFVDAAPVTESDLQGHRLSDAATILRRFHDSPPIGATFDWEGVPRAYAETARERGVSVPAAYEAAVAQASAVKAALAEGGDTPVPCHNDLLCANFLQDDEQLWLLDWEYAGMNTRYFDLGNLAVSNGFDAEADERLLAAYFGEVDDPHRARLTLMKVMSDLREAMWGVVQQAISTLDFDFVGYADEHFERLLHNASRPDWSDLLDQASHRA